MIRHTLSYVVDALGPHKRGTCTTNPPALWDKESKDRSALNPTRHRQAPQTPGLGTQLRTLSVDEPEPISPGTCKVWAGYVSAMHVSVKLWTVDSRR